MKNFKTGKFLAAAAAGAMMFAGAAAQAQSVITWNPGTPSAIGTAALTGSGTHYDGAAVKTDRINMVAVNDTFTDGGTCANGTGFSCWNLNFDSDGNFTESFTFLVTTTILSTDGTENRRFGDTLLADELEPGPYTQSFVSVQATLAGTLDSGAAGFAALTAATSEEEIADLLALTYNSGTFAYSFHEDLDASGTSVAIGTFNLLSGVSGNGVVGDKRIDLGWDTAASADLSPEWTDANGNPFDPFDTLLNDITQGVEIVEKQGFSAAGGAIAIRSRGAIVGFSEFPAVPEPGALALFGIGLIGLGAIARRRAIKGAAQA